MSTENPASSERYWLCPLYSFDCDCKSVDLAEGIQIKHAPSELREYIRDRTYHLYGRWDDPSEFDWAAFLPYRAEVVGESADMGIEEQIRENARRGFEEGDRASDLLVGLITALRLCHEGKITAGPLISAAIDNSQWSFGGSTIWTSVSQRDFLHKEPKYILHQSDFFQITELIKNLNHLRAKKEPDSLGIALRRFNSSYRGEISDRLVDQVVAFEFLYLGYDQELKYRLALRAAFLLGKDAGERKDIFNKMRKAYKIRSDIVHGSKQLGWSELEEVVSETEEYLRQSIRKFLSLLSQGHTLKRLRQDTDDRLAELDENILNSGTLLDPNSFGTE